MTSAAALVALVLAAPAVAGRVEVSKPLVPPRAIQAQVNKLVALEPGVQWAAVLSKAASSSAKSAASLTAEALARPELLSALPGGAALEAVVAAVHADPASRSALLAALEPLRWRAYFDGGAQPKVAAEGNLPGMLYGYGDPAALRLRSGYYVAATSNNAPDAGPIVRSSDLQTWRSAGFIFPRGRRPAWHDDDPQRYDFWAPELHKVGPGRYVAYYTARDRAGELRIGAAHTEKISGPWIDLGRPLISDPRVGLIDAHFFRDQTTGKRYLLWKKDGNQPHIREKTTVYISELSEDGLALVGARREILENDQPWEHELVEGLWMLKRGGWYYLLYSGNDYTTDKYAMGMARSRSPLGPFEKSPERLLSTGALFHGPGHCSVVKGPHGEDLLVYHAYRPGQAGYRKDRLMRVERISWLDGWPRVGTGFAGGPPPRPR